MNKIQIHRRFGIHSIMEMENCWRRSLENKSKRAEDQILGKWVVMNYSTVSKPVRTTIYTEPLQVLSKNEENRILN